MLTLEHPSLPPFRPQASPRTPAADTDRRTRTRRGLTVGEPFRPWVSDSPLQGEVPVSTPTSLFHTGTKDHQGKVGPSPSHPQGTGPLAGAPWFVIASCKGKLPRSLSRPCSSRAAPMSLHSYLLPAGARPVWAWVQARRDRVKWGDRLPVGAARVSAPRDGGVAGAVPWCRTGAARADSNLVFLFVGGGGVLLGPGQELGGAGPRPKRAGHRRGPESKG